MKSLISSQHVAKQGLLPYAETTLRVSRVTGVLGGVAAPPHVKVGGRVFYDQTDLSDWLAQFKKRRHTGDAA